MKKQMLLSKLLCLFLILATLSMLAVGCKNEEEEPVQTQPNTNTSDKQYDANGFLMDNLPDLNFNKEVRIVVSTSQKNQVAPSEMGEDVVANAIYQRNETVADRLGIEIDFIPIDTPWDGRETFTQIIKSTCDSGDAYDALAVYNPMPGALAIRGLLDNLGNTKYIDLQGPWWPASFVNEVVIDNTLFTLVESSSKGTLRNMHGVFFNNDLIKDYKLDDPYKMVKENKWTFANMMALIKDTGADKDNTPGKSADDFFGVVTGTQAKLETWFFGMGYKYCTKNQTTGELELTMSDVNYMLEFIDAFNTATATNDFLLWDNNGHTKAFFSNRAILYMSSVQLVESGVNNGHELDYGVVPLPKKNSEQQNYATNIANSHDVWCIPVRVDDMDVSSAILECMASEAYRQIAPVYFDQCVKLRYAPDERLGEMYDLIRSSIVFDFTSIYQFAFDKDPRGVLHGSLINPDTMLWNDQWGANEGMFLTGFENLLALYSEAK